jgi:thymidylate kinase
MLPSVTKITTISSDFVFFLLRIYANGYYIIPALNSDTPVFVHQNFQVGTEPDIVIFFDCPEDEMVKRLLVRKSPHFTVVRLTDS